MLGGFMAKLHFFYAPVNAGKTAYLIHADHAYHLRGLKTLRFTPLCDDRFGVGKIRSRVGLEIEAIALASGACPLERTVAEMLKLPADSKIDCIFVDEAQFLNRLQIISLCRICDELEIPVMAYGLRSDFKGNPFEGSSYLFAWADHIQEIKTVSATGETATMNARLNADKQQVYEGAVVDIGLHYEPVSRKTFNLPKAQGVVS